jgi:drug/metabolite transporter superfamily protein YnfA
MMTFKRVNIVNCVVSALLFLLLLFYQEPVFILFDIEGNDAAYFICRRAAMLFGGYAVISFFTRDLQSSITRQAVSPGFAFAMAGLALMGTIECIRGFAGGGILVAAAGELFLAVSYCYIWLLDRKSTAGDQIVRASRPGIS